MNKKHSKNIKDKAIKKNFWRKFWKEVLSLILACLLAAIGGVLANPQSRESIKKILKHSMLFVKYRIKTLRHRANAKKHRAEAKKHRAEAKKHRAEYKKYHNLIQERNKKTRKERAQTWQVMAIPYPVREEFIELPIIASKRAAVASYRGINSQRYKKILEQSNAVYNTAIKKIPKKDPVWISLWMAYEFSFLIRVEQPLSRSKVREIENIVEILLNAKHSKSKFFLAIRRLEYIERLLYFLQNICKKSLVKCNPDLLYKFAKQFSPSLYRLDEFMSKKKKVNRKSFLDSYILLLDIYLSKFSTTNKEVQREEIKNLIKSTINHADIHNYLLLEEKSLTNQYAKIKNEALAKCNIDIIKHK